MPGKIALLPLVALLGLCACGLVDVADRNLTTNPVRLGLVADDGAPSPQVLRPAYRVQDVAVTVPETLRVSEANLYYPFADIVWRGEPRGDRYAQIAAIFETAIASGTERFETGPLVLLEVEVRRFHALTEKARVTFGGVHSIRFVLTLRDAASGEAITGPQLFAADLRASGGRQALDEDARGYTQKVAITEHLAQVIARALSVPVSPAPDTTRDDASSTVSRNLYRPNGFALQ